MLKLLLMVVYSLLEVLRGEAWVHDVDALARRVLLGSEPLAQSKLADAGNRVQWRSPEFLPGSCIVRSKSL